MSERRHAAGALALLVALAAALVAAGCSQEGKLIEVPLATNAVATSFLPVSIAHLVSGPELNRVVNVRFKINVHAANACEAQHTILELRRIDGSPIVYQVIPVARYNADDKCTMDASGPVDTTFVLDVNGLLFGGTDSLSARTTAFTFQVPTPGAPAITLVLDTVLTAHTPNTDVFVFRVEDRVTGVPVAGATVAIDQLGPGGSVTPLDSSLTNAAGLDTLPVVAPADSVGAPNLPYRARVTSGATTRVVSMPSFPARLQRLEKLVIRL